MKELAKKYDHQQVETGKYQKWVKAGYFTAGDKSKEPFTIVIPPPNVTGKLHLGHAWDNTLQDIIIRYQRLLGKDVLYLPGMDHAGIATQAKVDERLKQEGVSRYDIGREKFMEKAWEWKEEYAGHIRKQWEKLGIAVDYSRERFTLDAGLSKAVTEVFVTLYNEGLIYRGERIINWDVQAKTALSNIEVIHKEIEGAFYTFKYPLVGEEGYLEVATTRPETMFGDVCLVVHPDDPRYQQYIGKKAINPANGEALEIIADDYIDIEFGTGVMKCTPAHDPNDFEIAKRHNLAKVICMNPDGTMNEKAGDFEGMERFACRQALVEKIKAEGNLIKIEKHIHQVGHSERTDVIVEPYLSKQWFVKMDVLAQDVLKNQEISDEKINFYPERFDHTFNQWLENIEDWCISRQLWWGHSIPAWYHNETGEVYVGKQAPADIENWTQDPDVLDTWFSSALWPFSTLGWPEKTDDFNRYYPNDVMVTGYDIIFFWVARMAFQARHFTHSRPFKDVLIHGLIRDAQGRKMSKSLGNGVDPMDVIEQYGVDALRFFLTTNSTPGQDMRYMEEKVEAAWNFINKIWNASRFVLMNIDTDASNQLDVNHLSGIDGWVLNRMNETICSVKTNLDKYEMALAGNEMYHFVWNDFCNWYIELSKANLRSENSQVKMTTQATLALVLKNIIIMLHPFMPFVTDEIYQALTDGASIYDASYPQPVRGVLAQYQEVDIIINTITAIRETKVTYNLKPSTPLSMMLTDQNQQPINLSETAQEMLAMIVKTTVASQLDDAVIVPISGVFIHISKDQLVDVEAEKARLNKEKSFLENEISRAEKMLSNTNFTAKAPAAKVEAERQKLADYQTQYDVVMKQIEALKNQ